jgi:positive regulator of sigma E activity
MSRLNTIKDLLTYDSNMISQYLLKENIITIEIKEKLLLQVFMCMYLFMHMYVMICVNIFVHNYLSIYV